MNCAPNAFTARPGAHHNVSPISEEFKAEARKFFTACFSGIRVTLDLVSQDV